MAPTTMAQALNAALRDALDGGDDVIVLGEDIGRLGGVFRVTDGLARTFGEDRCFDTPLAEAGIVGFAVGMAMAGFRPVVEIQFDAFAYPAFEQVVSHVAKLRNRTRGAVSVPMVIRIPYGGGIGGVEHHCDSSEAYFAHTPGLKVVTPATVEDAYSLLREAIDDPDPVVFLEPKKLYWSQADVELPATTAPFGRAVVRRPGVDATLITYGPSVPVALEAADAAGGEGWDLEVLDLRTLVPFDDENVSASVRRTGRCVVIHEAQGFVGVGAEIAARVQERCFHSLLAPVLRVSGFDIPYPAPKLEHVHLPHVDRILDAVSRLQWDDLPQSSMDLRRHMSVTASEQVFLLPDLGEGLTEAEIVEWRVDVGDTITVDQTVVEVETAKATVEVPCPYAGRVLALHVRAGETLDVGRPLISVGAGDAGSDGVVMEQPSQSASHAAYRVEEPAGSGNVLIGYGTGDPPGQRRMLPKQRPQDEASPAARSTPPRPVDTIARPARVISPFVRRLLREHGLDPANITPAGAGGVIRRRDIDAALAARAATSPGASASSPSDDVRIPLRGMRRTIADKLTRSRREIPHATTWVDVDATELLEAKAAMQATYPDANVGLLALLARICVAGIARFPELNSYVDTERNDIVQLSYVHLGIAAQTPRGLVVPVIRHAHAMTTTRLAAALGEVTAKAREGKLAPEHMTGGTFTLNNYGVFGVDGSTQIINPPEAAILGVGRVVDKPWAFRGQLTLRKVVQLSLSFDHRVCDGRTVGGFLRFVADSVEQPMSLLARL